LSLKPQDICVLLKLVALDGAPWAYGPLACELGMSASEVHAGVRRASAAGLMHLGNGWGTADVQALEEFLIYGVRYAFAPELGGTVKGMPTAAGAPPLDRLLGQLTTLPLVWPHVDGDVTGRAISPLYKSVPLAASRHPRLYELLALVDAIRAGDARERDLAVRELRARLRAGPHAGNVVSLARTSRAAAAALRAGPIPRGQDGEEAKRIYRRRHRDS
jgi:hypothetical protein